MGRPQGPQRLAWSAQGPHGLLFPSLAAGATRDLAAALELSGGAGRVGRQALVQRGLLRRLQGRDDDARRDFAQAARLGSAFARHQLVRMNPYAALCNAMLANAMKQLQRGPPGQDHHPTAPPERS